MKLSCKKLMRAKTRAVLALFLVLAMVQVGKAQPQPDQWWLKAKGTQIQSYNQFRQLVIPKSDLGNTIDLENDKEAGSLANTHIVMEFYMEWCHFCKEFVSEWNSIIDQMDSKYNKNGENKVKFLMVDGTKQNELRRRYKVQGFPQFVYIKPGTKAKVAKSFEDPRTKENMISWIEDNIQKFDKAANSAHHDDHHDDHVDFATADQHQQFAKDFKEKQDEIQKMSAQQVDQEIVKMGSQFGSAASYLNQHLGSLDKDLGSHLEKSKLFEEEYLLKQKRIGQLYKSFKEEFVRSQMFKDGAMFLIGFVGGLIVTVVFIVISMPSGQGKGVPQKIMEKSQVVDEEDGGPRVGSKGFEEGYLESKNVHRNNTHGLEETGASSGMQMYEQDDFIDEESSDSANSSRLSQRQPHSQRKKT